MASSSSEAGKYFSAEESLSSASLEDGESSNGSVETDENLLPIVDSTESVKIGPVQEEVIRDFSMATQRNKDTSSTSLDSAAGPETHCVTSPDPATMKVYDISSKNLSSTISEQDPQVSTSTIKPSQEKRHHTSLPGDNGYDMRATIELVDSSTADSILGTDMPVYGQGVEAEINVQPKTYNTVSLNGSLMSVPAEPCSSEIPASGKVSGTTVNGLDSICMSETENSSFRKVRETFQQHTAEGDSPPITPGFEPGDENELDARDWDETSWDVNEFDHDDSLDELRLDGELDDHGTKKHDMLKVPEKMNENEENIFSWPAALLTKAIYFQIKTILFGLFAVMWLFNLFFVEPINMLILGRDMAVSGTNNIHSLFVNGMQSLGNLRAQVGITLKKAAKKLGVGVLTATYVSIVLCLLVIPALLLGFLIGGRFVERPIEIQEQIYFDYTQPSPSAAISLFPAPIMPKVKALATTHPGKILNQRLVPLNHKFDVTVILKMPESEHNLHIGMFQVSAELISLKGHQIARFTRPCMLYFHSWPIRYAKTVLLAMPLLFGLYSESQVVAIQLIEAYEDKTEPAATVNVLLEPRAGYLPGSGVPEVYSADIIIQSQLPWAKSVVYQWKWTFYVWSGLGWFFFEVALLLCCCRRVLFPLVPFKEGNGAGSRAQTQDQNHLPAIQENLISLSEGPVRGRVSFEDDIPIASVSFDPGSSATGIPDEELEALMGTKEDLDIS